MRNRVIFIIASALVGLTALEAQNNNSLIFLGMNTSYAAQDGTTKNTGEVSLVEQINDMKVMHQDKEKQIVISQSQGGLRALGYAGLANQDGKGDRIEGVITIGAPVKGHPAIANGASVTAQRAVLMKDILCKGLDAQYEIGLLANAVVPSGNFFQDFFTGRGEYYNWVNYKDANFTYQGQNWSSFLDKTLNYYYKSDFYGLIMSKADEFISKAAAQDMKPNCKYIKDYITGIGTVAGEWVKVKTTSATAGEFFIYLITSMRSSTSLALYGLDGESIYKSYVDNEYTYFYIVSSVTYVSRLPAQTKVGFIVCKENQPLAITKGASMDGTNLEESANMVWDIYGNLMRAGLEKCDAIDERINIAYNKLYWPWEVDQVSSNLASARSFVSVRRGTLTTGKDLHDNLAVYYGNVLGEVENDLFVPASSQYYAGGTLGQPIDGVSGIYEVPDAYHGNLREVGMENVTYNGVTKSEWEHPAIWGTGGRMNYNGQTAVPGCIQPGGILYKWYERNSWTLP